MRPFLLFILLVQLAAAATTVVLTYTVKPWGDVTLVTKTRELVINDGPEAVVVSGVLIPPYSASVIEREVRNVYPPFLKIDVSVEYINATLDREVLRADETSLVRVVYRFSPLLNVAVPVVISVPINDEVAVIFEKVPTSMSQISGMSVYYWTLLVDRETTFELKFKVKRFGSFGATRLPTIAATAALDLNHTLRGIKSQMRSLSEASLYVANLSSAVGQFADLINWQLQNLTQLVQIFRLTGLAMLQGADGVNMSAYALEAFRRQILALGNAAETVANTINQTLLLVDYQYTALITAANLLEVQSSALTAYKKAARDAEAGITQNRESLLQVRRSLVEIRDQIQRSIYKLERAKKDAESLPGNVSSVVVSALSGAITQLQELRSAVDSLLASVDAAVSALDASIYTLQETQRSLGELAPLLNSTAASTRSNATVLRRETPNALVEASRNLAQLARQLYFVAEDVLKFTTPLAEASRILRDVGSRLIQSADELETFRRRQLETLPRVGVLQSVVLNFSKSIQNEMDTLRLQLETLNRYYRTVNFSRVEIQHYLELPVAVKDVTIKLPSYETKGDRKTGGEIPPAYVAALLALAAAAGSALFLRKFRS